jgi:hypothetical protein
MRWNRRLTIATLLGLVACSEDQATKPPVAEAQQPVAHWVDTAERLDARDSCMAAVRRQLALLRDDTLSERIRPGDYPAELPLRSPPAPLDVSSLRSAREFRTKLGAALETAGVNFSGHYSIVEVGMTGWGPNYWIVDRRNGRAYEFPYKAVYMDFAPESRLIVMDSKSRIMSALRNMAEPQESCALMGARRHSELRPFHFQWRNNRLEQVAPASPAAPINEFWSEYFGKRQE